MAESTSVSELNLNTTVCADLLCSILTTDTVQ